MIKLVELGPSVSEERHQHVGYYYKLWVSYIVNGKRDTEVFCREGSYRTLISTYKYHLDYSACFHYLEMFIRN